MKIPKVQKNFFDGQQLHNQNSILVKTFRGLMPMSQEGYMEELSTCYNLDSALLK